VSELFQQGLPGVQNYKIIFQQARNITRTYVRMHLHYFYKEIKKQHFLYLHQRHLCQILFSCCIYWIQLLLFVHLKSYYLCFYCGSILVSADGWLYAQTNQTTRFMTNLLIAFIYVVQVHGGYLYITWKYFSHLLTGIAFWYIRK
jgi:hypothetical protein